MSFGHEVETCLRSRFTFIHVISFEEAGILEDLRVICEKRQTALYVWDHADHFRTIVAGNENAQPTARDALSALDAIDKLEGRAVFVLRDFHQCWHNQPRVIRKLRNLADALKYTHKTLVVTAPVSDLPVELKDAAAILDYQPPDVDDLKQILNALLSAPNVETNLDEAQMEKLIRCGLGLSSNQAQRVFAKAIVSEGVLDTDDIALVTREKSQVIRGFGALQLYDSRETTRDVGGLEVLKNWLRLRESAFGPEARAYGLPEPKGIALIGIPGTGKSLTAKMVAGLWSLPLLRLDIGAIYGSLVGESEENARRALELAQTISPCVLWIDELEKSIASGGGDGGTSMRVFATLLSWMQEKEKPVFVVATANDISKLPPELLRRGRFDEIFFLDLPTTAERREILSVHVSKRGRDPSQYDLTQLAEASAGYVGAEIEQAIIDAMYHAFNDEDSPAREFTTDDIARALRRLVPMSRSQKENVHFLREWLREGRAQSASFQEREDAEIVPRSRSSSGRNYPRTVWSSRAVRPWRSSLRTGSSVARAPRNASGGPMGDTSKSCPYPGPSPAPTC